VIKEDEIGGYVARGTSSTSVGRPECKRQLARPRMRLEDNIKMGLKAIGW
jgi:hypothetical protein